MSGPFGQSLAQISVLITSLLAAEGAVINFENNRVGELPTGWRAAKTGEGPGSVWRVVKYERSGQRNQALAQTSSAGPNSLFNLCVLPEIKQADVDLSVQLLAQSGEHDRGGGVVWRYHDANNYYITRWNPLEDNFRAYHVVNGKRTQLASADVKLPADQWHSVRVVQRGHRTQCYMDDKLLLEVTDETIPAAGALGLWTKADAVTWFDDFRLNAPAKE